VEEEVEEEEEDGGDTALLCAGCTARGYPSPTVTSAPNISRYP
jgi:hypothetical protein